MTAGRRRSVARAVAPLLALGLLVASTVPTAAAAPSNDDAATPTVIPSIPFTDVLGTAEATTGATDPSFCDLPELGPDAATVWYAFAPTAPGPLGATTFGSDYGTALYVGTDDGAGGINVLACNVLAAGTQQSAVRFDAEAGVQYLFVVGAQSGGTGGGQLVFNLDVGPPAQQVTLAVEPAGSFTREGTAIVRGTFGCTATAPNSTGVIVELSQFVGRRLIYASEVQRIEDCPSEEVAWAIELRSPDGRFAGGRAAVQVIAVACNPFECVNRTLDLEIGLRR